MGPGINIFRLAQSLFKGGEKKRGEEKKKKGSKERERQ